MGLILPKRKLLHLLQASLLLAAVFAAAKLLGVGNFIAGEVRSELTQQREPVDHRFIDHDENSFDATTKHEVAETDKSWVSKSPSWNFFITNHLGQRYKVVRNLLTS